MLPLPFDLETKAVLRQLSRIHPFDDGNGRIARAITDLLLSRAEGHARRFYSMSSSIMQHRRDYYDVLERTQHGDGEITDWLQWFLACLSETIEAVLERISTRHISYSLETEAL